MDNEQIAKNTNREIWRKGGGDGNGMSYYEPSIHVTQDEHIGINVGGTIFEKPVEEWHSLAKKDNEINRLRRFLARIASLTELTGDGPLEEIFNDPSGIAERELKARIQMAQRGLDNDEYP